MSDVHIIAGLGNPGETYERTRHNVGFMTVDRLSDRHGGGFRKGKGSYVETRISVGGAPVILVKPLTFMNLSGQAVQQVVQFYKVTDLDRLLVVVDDFHLPFGTLRLRPGGSAAGQKGLQSVMQSLATPTVPRLRIGIGTPRGNPANYVLTPFGKAEQADLPLILDHAADAVERTVSHGLTDAMNLYNKHLLDD